MLPVRGKAMMKDLARSRDLVGFPVRVPSVFPANTINVRTVTFVVHSAVRMQYVDAPRRLNGFWLLLLATLRRTDAR